MSRKQRADAWDDDIARYLTDPEPYSFMLEKGSAAEQREYWAEVAKRLADGSLHEDASQRLAAALSQFAAKVPAERAFGLNAGNRGSYAEELRVRNVALTGQLLQGAYTSKSAQAVLDAEANLAAAITSGKSSAAVKQARAVRDRARGKLKTAIRRLK